MNYSPSIAYSKGNSFISQLITLVAWIGLAACVIQLYFLIAEGKDFLRGWAGVVHYDTGWNKLIQFYGGLGFLCFGIATGIGLKFIAAVLVGLYLVSAMGSTFYVKTMKAPTALPTVQGASVGKRKTAPQSQQQPENKSYQYSRAQFGTTNAQRWTNIALSKNMKIVRPLKANEIKWCKSGVELDYRNKINCNTGKVWKY